MRDLLGLRRSRSLVRFLSSNLEALAVVLFCLMLLLVGSCAKAIQPTEIIAATRTGDRFHDCIISMLTVFAEAAIHMGDDRSGGVQAAGGGDQGSGSISGGRDEQVSYQTAGVNLAFEEFALITSVCAMTEESARQFIDAKMDCAEDAGCDFILDSKWIYEAALQIRQRYYVPEEDGIP